MTEDIINFLNICVIELDDQQQLQFINSAAENLLEISGKQAQGHHISEIFDLTSEIEMTLVDALQSEQTFTARKAKLRLVSGTSITCDYCITPVHDGNIATTLVELYPLDRYLKIDRDESISVQHQTSRQMIRGLAHEIKNPLGGIKGSAQLLAKELPTEDLKAYTEIIVDETDRLTTLVDRLLGPRTLPSLAMTNIHEVTERVRTLIKLEATPDLVLKTDYDPSIPEINIDAERIVQVVLNIARNAMQSLEHTEHPEITFISRVERLFTIGTTQHKLVIKIGIKDNGPGVAPEIAEQLFYPMITSRPEGTGLGLSVAQSIVHQHKGLIEFDSEHDGTTFSIYLPLEI